jgi:hypothetical protein
MVYVSKFKKEIWPLYIPPFHDELFSSWMFRLSNKHRVSPEVLINESLIDKMSIKFNSIDVGTESQIIDILAQNTPVKVENISELFLTSYKSNILENNNAEEIFKSVLFLKFKGAKRKQERIVFCSNCLSKENPYFRKKWTLSTSIICCECNSYLIDYCPSCYNSFSYLNINKSSIQINTSITTCKCGYDISKNSFQMIPSKLEMEYQNYIDFTIKNGFNDHTQYSFTYLNVLIFTASMIKSIIKTSKYKRKLLKVYPDLIMDIKVPINKWTLSDRQHLLPIAFYLLQDFPNRIKDVFPKKYNLKKEFVELPYWFEKELIYR